MSPYLSLTQHDFLSTTMANPVQSPASADSGGNPVKRRKLTLQHLLNQKQSLIPGLPDHIAQLCLSLVPPWKLYQVCQSWRRLIYSSSFPAFLSLYAVFSSVNPDGEALKFLAFDSVRCEWDSLPPLPQEQPLCVLLRHPSFISRHLPIQTVSTSGKLLLLAATNHDFSPAIPRPLLFDPLSRTWSYGPSLATPRRWCAAGGSCGAVYVASGIGSHFNTDVAKSMERWDLRNHKTVRGCQRLSGWKWEKVKGLRDVRFSRDAIDAVGWRGKVCMVNVKGDAAKEGVVYDVENDEWNEMAEGMVAGWKGPVAAMEEKDMYVVDEGKGVLRKYDEEKDLWEELMEDERLRGAQHMAAGGGKLCVICGGGIMVLDVTVFPIKLWVVQSPPGVEPVALHILPRMAHFDA